MIRSVSPSCMKSVRKLPMWARSALYFAIALAAVAPLHAQQRWTEAQANKWYAGQPWPVGANFLPSTAINELEMWQADTFDPTTIDRELGWAESIGMNTMRVFLHNLLWDQDPKGFKKRIDTFLAIAARTTSGLSLCCSIPAGIRIQSSARSTRPFPACTTPAGCRAPGAEILADPAKYPRLEKYVKES